MSCFIGTARLARGRIEDRWSGTVLLVAQPAEEGVGGARAMLDDGLYSPLPQARLRPGTPLQGRRAGRIVWYCPGPMLASSTSVNITIRGKGGHGAWPHRTVDPIVLSALVVVDLQTIVSREIDPSEPAVVTVGSIHGGTKHNIIPDEVKLQLTLRSFQEAVRQQFIAGIKRRIARIWPRRTKAPEPTVEVEECPSRRRSIPPSGRAGRAGLREALGPETSRRPSPSWVPRISPSTAKANVPICMFWIGTMDTPRLEAAAIEA